jgi:tRNA(Ile2)-agmatinylcytidine synthase
VLLHIGFDDTDSPSGGCTTYLAALLVDVLSGLGARFVDYPNLLRLNPNVPWKTRGNGAVCLRVEIDESREEEAHRSVLNLVESYSYFDCENTNPGVVFLEGAVPAGLVEFSERVVKTVVSLDDALMLADEHEASAIGFKNMRGIIGGLAAVGGLQRGDHTYEFLGYRLPGNWGTPRRVDPDSVVRMDEATGGSTFNNVDPETGRVLIAPKGPDPVLFGIRGEDPLAVREAGLMVDSEPLERWVVFRTNQGTDAHLGSLVPVLSLKPYSPAILEGLVSGPPKTIKGGHVFVGLTDETGRVDCAAYEPSGSFRVVVRRLIPGDRVRVYGGVRGDASRERLTFNMEKLEVLGLARDLRKVNPKCPECGGSMESMGRGKGFRCRSCGFRGAEMEKRTVEEERKIGEGLFLPPPRAQRHLSKPKVRYGREKSGITRPEPDGQWHWP